MKVSVIIITFNEERNIEDCLKSFINLDFSKEDFEVLVVDGGSKDKTQSIVEEYMKKNKNIKFYLDTKGGSQTTSRNMGIRKAKYDYIAFTDADCIVPRDWLDILTNKFTNYKERFPKLAGVGGANIPPSMTTKFTQAIGVAFDSFLGSLGSIQAKRMSKDKKVFSISCSNAFYDKKRLVEAGMFTEGKGKIGDDWEVGLKLKKKSYILLGLKDSFVWHKFRASPSSFWKNMLVYGDVRMRYIIKFTKYNGPFYYLPLVFALAMVSTLFSFVNPLFLLPLAYFPFMFLYSLYLCIKRNRLSMLHLVFMVFLIQHFGYSIGEIKGLRWFRK